MLRIGTITEMSLLFNLVWSSSLYNVFVDTQIICSEYAIVILLNQFSKGQNYLRKQYSSLGN